MTSTLLFHSILLTMWVHLSDILNKNSDHILYIAPFLKKNKNIEKKVNGKEQSKLSHFITTWSETS